MNPIDELNLKLGIGPRRPALPPELVKKGYKSIKQVGKGAFGCANLVFNDKTKQYSVAKEVAFSGLSDKAKKEAMNEVHILSSLNHPNIVIYQECLEMKEKLFIIMEYCDGGDLGTKIRTKKTMGTPFREAEAARVFSQLALAMKYLHDRRILHRDLKVQNVFLTNTGVVKLGDFGIATILQNSITMAKTICGTPFYFSPELCKGEAYNNKSDIWALGVILYEILALDVPFKGPIFSDLMKHIVESPTPKITSGSYSENWNVLIGLMLQKDYKARPGIDDVLTDDFLRSQFRQLEAAFQRQAEELIEERTPVAGRRKSENKAVTPPKKNRVVTHIDTSHRVPVFGRRSPKAVKSDSKQEELKLAVEGLDMAINGVGAGKKEDVEQHHAMPEQPVDVVKLQKEFRAVADLCKHQSIEEALPKNPKNRGETWGDSWQSDLDLTANREGINIGYYNQELEESGLDFTKADPTTLPEPCSPPARTATSPNVRLAAAQALIETLTADLKEERTKGEKLRVQTDQITTKNIELTQENLMLRRKLKTVEEELAERSKV